MNQLYLVADDLTGALDSAACFSGRFGPIPVFLGPGPDRHCQQAAVDLATRDGDAASALRVTAQVLEGLAGAEIAFKKIDSLLRGHWAVELAESLRHGHFRTCILAPAFPGQGRVMRDGRQIVRATDGSERTVEVDPGALLRQLGLSVRHAAAFDPLACLPSTRDSADVVLCDAGSDQELEALVRSGARLGRPVLWCGSAGLAQALAGQPTPRIRAVQAPLLAIVGTDHAVTAVQAERATAAVPARRVVASADAPETAARIARAFELTGACLLSFDLPRSTLAADAAAAISRSLRELLPLTRRPATLLVTGGATLLSVCSALGAGHLEVGAEYSPGIPRSRLCGGRWDGLSVISKSGAFGDPDLIAELMRAAA